MGKKMAEKYDLVTIGGGSAAFSAAIKAAEADAKVLIVEKETIGGTCVNRGCVPSKNILHAAELAHEYHTGEGFPGIPHGNEPASFTEIFKQKDALVEDLRQAKYLDILAHFPNIQSVEGKAAFKSKDSVQLNGNTIKAGMFLIASGASPSIPPIPGIETIDYVTYREAISPEKQPASMIVVGGGPIGLELGQTYQRLGTQVTIIESLSTLAPHHEAELGIAMEDYMTQEGITILSGSMVDKVEKTALGCKVSYHKNDEFSHVEAEQLLVATGVRPNTKDLSTDRAGIQLGQRGEVVVDKYLRTGNKRIYAAGDVTGQKFLVTTAAYQGGIAVENGLLGRKVKYENHLVPHAIFTTPQVAAVGLTEREAQTAGFKTQVSLLNFEHVPKAATIRNTKGIIKLIANSKNGQILGVHAACPPGCRDHSFGNVYYQSKDDNW